MNDAVFMVGLGGQGVLLAGQLLAQTALEAGLEVSWYPSYSPEVRGGEATCTVVISDRPVRSPIIGRPRSLLAMDPGALAAYEPTCAEGGLVVVNTSLGEARVSRPDLQVVRVAASQLAEEAGSDQAANMVILGAYLGCAHPELEEVAVQALRAVLPAHRHKYIPISVEALRRGSEAARAQSRGAADA